MGNKFLTVICLTVFSLSQTGCASIVSGKTQDVMISSNPPGATVYVNGMNVGQTPLTKEFKRKKRHKVELKKVGYIDEMRMTKRGYNWWNAGNIILGGIIGIIIDFATGAVYSVEPEELNVSLMEGNSSLSTNASSVTAGEAASEVRVASRPAYVDEVASIEKLGELKEKGLITDEEFQKKKEEILGLDAEV